MGKIAKLLKNPEQVTAVAKEAFDAIDSDKSGFVDEFELAILMKIVAQDCGVDAPTKADVSKALKILDTNNDGKISVDEFRVLVVEILKALAEQEIN